MARTLNHHAIENRELVGSRQGGARGCVVIHVLQLDGSLGLVTVQAMIPTLTDEVLVAATRVLRDELERRGLLTQLLHRSQP